MFLRAQSIPLLVGTGALLLTVAYPLFWLLLTSLGVPEAVTLRHLWSVLRQGQTIEAVRNTGILFAGTAIGSTLLGVPVAYATARTDSLLRRFTHFSFIAAFVLPPYLTALAYIQLLSPRTGYINVVLSAWKIPVLDIYSMGGVVFTLCLHGCAFSYLLTYGALLAMDGSLESAARILGARRWVVLSRITFPLVWPAIAGGAILAGVQAMADFGPQLYLGLPAQLTFLPTEIYGYLGYPPGFAEAAGLSLLLLLLTGLTLYVQRKQIARRSVVMVTGRAMPPDRARLAGWRFPIAGLIVVVLLLITWAPIAALLLAALSQHYGATPSIANLTLQHFRTVFTGGYELRASIINSMELGVAAASFSAFVGFIVTYLDQRTTIRWRKVLDYLASLPLGIPGTVMGLAVLLAFIRPPFSPIYETDAILLIAYVAITVGFSARSCAAGFAAIDPALEEAARIAGGRRWVAVTQVLLPLVWSSVVVAWVLSFVVAFGDFSATVLLYGPTSATVSISIWDLEQSGQFGPLAALAILTVAIAMAVAAGIDVLLNRRGEDGGDVSFLT